nr:extracellular solute-binding protein [Frigoribacterium sp. PvP032]MBP1189951.1 hypothetical protein [Frigoribacterium sp. PvP032]
MGDEPVTIDWWSANIATNEGGDLRPRLIEEFNEEYPNVRINLVAAPADTDTNRTTLTTQIAAGSQSPDVIHGDIAWPGQFAENSLATPLSTLVPDDFWDQYPEGLRSAASVDGEYYMFPVYIDNSFLVYRQDILQDGARGRCVASYGRSPDLDARELRHRVRLERPRRLHDEQRDRGGQHHGAGARARAVRGLRAHRPQAQGRHHDHDDPADALGVPRDRRPDADLPDRTAARPAQQLPGPDHPLRRVQPAVRHLDHAQLPRRHPRHLRGGERDRRRLAPPTVFSVILPMSKPGLFTVGVFTFTASWSEFLMALTFNSETSFRTIPVGIALFGTQFTVPYGAIFAASVSATVPIVILVLIFRRSIVSGLTSGAVKG